MNPSKYIEEFLAEMVELLPNSEYRKRGKCPVKEMCDAAVKRGFTNLLIFTEDNTKKSVVIKEAPVTGLWVVKLPYGPTARFKLTTLVMPKKIRGHGTPTGHRPELILNNFNTRLGHRMGRMLACLFPYDPQFKGRQVATLLQLHRAAAWSAWGCSLDAWACSLGTHRVTQGHCLGTQLVTQLLSYSPASLLARLPTHLLTHSSPGQVVTLHNQRDFVFFRHHRYVFEQAAPGREVKSTLQELGPRFTLKLKSLQLGIFDTQHGEYEWKHKPELDTSRRRFHM